MSQRLFKEKYGPLALVAGASEGLGAAWCEALAARGLDLLMVARGREKLEQAAADIRKSFPVKVDILVCDLSANEAPSFVLNAIKAPVHFLVYNAAQPLIGPFLSVPVAVHDQISAVNMLSPIRLVHALGQSMMESGGGGMVLMSSLAGFQGSGFLSTYAATKAFNRILAESLWYEWRLKGIDIIACCPGATETPNYIRSKPLKASLFAPKPQSPQAVVEECLKRIGKVPSFVSGTQNKIASFFMQHVLPRKKAILIMGDTAAKIYDIRY